MYTISKTYIQFVFYYPINQCAHFYNPIKQCALLYSPIQQCAVNFNLLISPHDHNLI